MLKLCPASISGLLLTLFLAACAAPPVQEQPATPAAALSDADILRLGEQMYRYGILPDGSPVQAVVMGDIAVDGRQFTCDDCHQRSGIGSVEGTIITYPTNGKELYQPRRRTQAWLPPPGKDPLFRGSGSLPDPARAADARPAYTDESLAVALRVGVDPTGRKLNPVMPRYLLSGENMAILIQYLKQLSVADAPGVDAETLYLATVVSDGVRDDRLEAMLAVIRSHVETNNAQSRHQELRAESGVFYQSQKNRRYRRIEHRVWKLTGDRATWRGQLEAYYREAPVFALVGGMVEGSWEPVHRFSEEHRLPCILPITDLPVISNTDWYTLYFSKGFYQEGMGAARYLRRALPKDARLVQVAGDEEASALAAQGFRETWAGFRRAPARDIAWGAGGDGAADQLTALAAGELPPAAVLLWLPAEEARTALASLARADVLPERVFLASGFFPAGVGALPEALGDTVYITYPNSTPGEFPKREAAVESWLRSRGVARMNLRVQDQMRFMGTIVGMALGYIRSEFFRDYFMEGIDMMYDQDYTIASFPRLSFGPGQRYASKGCYVLQVAPGRRPMLRKQGDWIVH